MEKVLGNYLTQANKDFPLDCETLDYLQGLSAFGELVGNIAGDRVVLCGCELNDDGTKRSAGYVFLRTSHAPEGEVLPWEGGVITGGMYVKQEDVLISANNSDYPKAYTKRSLAPGIGEENYSWDSFTDVKTIKMLMEENEELRDAVKQIQPTPPGIIEMWAGEVAPDGYMICDGRYISIEEYPELYAAIGTSFNEAVGASGVAYTTPEGCFRLPDLRGRFVVGSHDADEDYQVIGQAGGKKMVALSVEQMPEHSHSLKDYYYAENANNVATIADNYDTIKTNGGIGGSRSDADNNTLVFYEHDTKERGAGSSHENRPPYYVLTYIIRVK